LPFSLPTSVHFKKRISNVNRSLLTSLTPQKY
jgi:hypothetical protein